MNTQLLIQLLVNGLIVGTLYGVVAMSFVLIYKATQVVNFAQGEFLLIGAWVLLVAADQVSAAVLARHAGHAGLHAGLRRRAAGLRAAPDDRRAGHLGDHGDDRPSTVFQAAMKWIFGTNLQPFPPIFATQTREHARAADADRLSDEPGGLAAS